MPEKRDWMDIDGYPNYRISNDHIVQNKKTGRILKQCDNSSGYPSVNLYNENGRSTKSVHRIVAETFVDGYEEGLVVNHRNGDKHENVPKNLEWVTPSENELHAHRTGLKYGPNRKPVRVVETGEVFKSVKDCARALNACDTVISRSIQDGYRSRLGLTFEYADKDSVNTSSNNETVAATLVERNRYRKPVRVIETGEIYPSVRECARAIGGDQPTITACLHGRHKSHHGYSFEYAYER